jgi:hypothetical protein
VITLGSQAFAGPFLAPLWSPSRSAAQVGGLYAVLVPGWRLLTFRAIYFGHTADFTDGLLKSHERHAEWLRIAGTDWNLYLATHEMSFSTEAQREAALAGLARDYRPEFIHPAAAQEAPSLKTMLLAQAMRSNKDE